MTIIKHPTNPRIFVGTADEFGLAVTGDYSAAGCWIAVVDGEEQDLLCSSPEQALELGETTCDHKARALEYANRIEAALASVKKTFDARKDQDLKHARFMDALATGRLTSLPIKNVSGPFSYGFYSEGRSDEPAEVDLAEAERLARSKSRKNDGVPVAVWDAKCNTVSLYAGLEKFKPVVCEVD